MPDKTDRTTFESDDHGGVTFSVPTRPTVRQQLRYYSQAASTPDAEMFERLWLAAVVLMRDGDGYAWECESLPDPSVDLDSISDPSLALMLLWAGTQVRAHMNALEDTPKN